MNWLRVNEDGEPVYTAEQLARMFQMYQAYTDKEKQKHERILDEEYRGKKRMQEDAESIQHREGAVISRVEPWAFAVDDYRLADYCSRCLVSKKTVPELKKCSSCSYLSYCGKTCQVADWTEHKVLCSLFKMREFFDRRALVDTKILTLFLKVLAKLKLHVQKNANPSNGTTRVPPHLFFNIKINDALVSKDERLQKTYNNWLPFIKVADDNGAVCADLPTFCRIYGRMMVALGPLHAKVCEHFDDTDSKRPCEIGLALPLSLATYQRSCMPNAAAVSSGGTQIAVKALKNIPNGEPITVGWSIDRFSTPDLREKQLRMRYLNCSCPGCTDPLVIERRNAVRCVNSKCEMAIPLDTRKASKCNHCKQMVSTDRMLEADVIMLELTQLFTTLNDKPFGSRGLTADEFKQLHQLYEKAKGLLHCTNLVLGMANRELANHFRSIEQHTNSIRHLKRMILSAEIHLGKYDEIVMTAMMDMFTYYLAKRRFKEGLPILEETRKRMSVIPGDDTDDYKAVDKLCRAMQKENADFFKYCKDMDWETIPAGK
ncbi:histone-lysine N-methyltransferase set-18-like [Paramacrobiotus metropolitanus]|uniref:histone-lysine N-methyltransferase set-18-like n=1 Tax=Paramacrobiotus metropolitanus TaxID=2943436 RepID=UPI0024462A30|nr:histone-lysine N-methyltransferase set-18-like [Paramacrobiotus metropolitanus]